MGASLTWNEIGNLTSIQTGTNPYMASGANQTIAYTYLSDGTRRTKTVNGRTTTYHYNNGLLLSETTVSAGTANGSGSTNSNANNADAETLSYYYGSTGKLASVTYQKGTNTPVSYFYAYNGQGDVIALYRSSDSVLIGTYEYDLWGRPVSVKEAAAGIDVNGILTKNPFRYRGYYYDEETGFYYLNARYYDPQVRRFISADNLIAEVGSTVQGHNLYVYSFSNPVNMQDDSGNWPREATLNAAKMTNRVADFCRYTGSPLLAAFGYVATAEIGATYVVQCVHYDVRKAWNTDLPQSPPGPGEGWKGPGTGIEGPAADCHQYTAISKDKPNQKFVSSDGHREVIFDYYGNLVTDPRDIGTYNVCPSEISYLGHFAFDILPWIAFGNDDDDPGPVLNMFISE